MVCPPSWSVNPRPNIKPPGLLLGHQTKGSKGGGVAIFSWLMDRGREDTARALAAPTQGLNPLVDVPNAAVKREFYNEAPVNVPLLPSERPA